ncbi:hypothetical protein AAMO2058_001352500 [Amorphochlora amoebiformis]|mmetsp:Transcript_5825/g.8933  ORF Transcript_5825/g.8933 Transcript_5825/m.8933 type:complete len:126 (-) Transcript_5825:245-622(-)
MSSLPPNETKLIMRILERVAEDPENSKWRSINLAKVKGKLTDTSLVILQQAGFQRTDTHMVLPQTSAHNRQARAVYMACMECIEYTPRIKSLLKTAEAKEEDKKSENKNTEKSNRVRGMSPPRRK